jgi:uncharacterized protein (DUF3820 family)
MLVVLKDTDIMTFGMHKGKEMQDVPASWLFWYKAELEKNQQKGMTITNLSMSIYEYIISNRNVLQKEIDESK